MRWRMFLSKIHMTLSIPVVIDKGELSLSLLAKEMNQQGGVNCHRLICSLRNIRVGTTED